MKGLRTRCKYFLNWRLLVMLAMVTILALAVACDGEEETPAPEETEEPTATATPRPTPRITPPPITTPPPATPEPTPVVTPTPRPLPTPLPAPTMQRQTETLLLEVSSPLGDTVLRNNLLQVAGRASPGASVSVNGRMTSRGEEGEFTIDVTLIEGPNLVEVIASDLSGGHKEAIFLVVYAP